MKKKYILAVLMSAIFMACFTSRAFAAGNDVITDGCINILDYEAQQQNFNKNATGDVNGDNKTDLKDVTLVMHDWKTGCVDNAQFVSQSSAPDSITKGAQQTLTFTVKNTGNDVWTQQENYALIAAKSQQNPDFPYDPNLWGMPSITVTPARVLPGQSTSFSFNITAPTTPGSYPMVWRMANVSKPQRFGDYSNEKQVSVFDPASPSVVLILTDDLNNEDWNYMHDSFAPYLQNQGLTFNNFIISNSMCCPSRASLLRGQYTQNTGVYTNAETGNNTTNDATSNVIGTDSDLATPALTPDTTAGGWQTFHDLGDETSTVATWVHARGYKTMLAGKYMNKFENTAGTIGQNNWYTPPGWDVFDAMIGEADHSRPGPHSIAFAENGNYVSYDTDIPGTPYNTLTNAITVKAKEFIQGAGGQPFFMYLAPHAPHGPVDCVAPYGPEQFSSLSLPYSNPVGGSFNENDVSDKPAWINSRAPLDAATIASYTDWYHRRLCTLEHIRDQVRDVVDTLTQTGRINNTYIIFTSDNGYHMGQHRLGRGKGTTYEEDIRVPFIIRGPGITPNTNINHIVSNIDFAPSVAALTGATPDNFVDGKSFVPLLSPNRPSEDAWRKQVFLTAVGVDPGISYGIRTKNMMYSKITTTGEEELYDLTNDPFELNNLANNPAYATIKTSMATKTQTLQTCSGQACRDAELLP